MPDLITYVPNLNDMFKEAVQISSNLSHPLNSWFIVEGDSVTFRANKIPVHYYGNKSLCLVRGISRSLLSQCKTILVLGECVEGEYIFDSEDSRDIYESLHEFSPREVEGLGGEPITHYPPYKIGVFV